MAAGAEKTRMLLEQVQQRLAALASPAVKRGQDAYFKGVIAHRGIKAPAVDAECKAFLASAAGDADAACLQALGLALLREPLQGAAAQWHAELRVLRGAYAGGHVFAWSTSDWICGRLLGPLIKARLQASAADGEACSRAILGWCREGSLWLRRSAVVSHLLLAKMPDDQVYPGFRATLLEALAVTVCGQERFAQASRCGCETGLGTGWVLRELGKGDEAALLQATRPRSGSLPRPAPCCGGHLPECQRTNCISLAGCLPPPPLPQFCEANLEQLSSEGLRYALEKQAVEVRRRLAAAHKERTRRRGRQEGAAGAAEQQGAPRKRARRGTVSSGKG
eukprot:scaffold14.g1221.t1